MFYLAPLAGVLSQATPGPAWRAEATPIAAGAQTTALLAKAVDDPLWTVGSDGMVHLEYDLLFTNVFAAPVTLTQVNVLAPDGRTLFGLEGAALLEMTRPTFGGAPTTTVPASGAVVTMLDVVLPPDQVPERVAHRITYALPADTPANTLISSTVITWPDILVEAGAPRVIASPLRGAGWLNANGCCRASPHRSARLAVDGSHLLDFELFAIDWIKLEDGRFFAGDGTRNEDHFAYGEAVFAVADGIVVSMHDGMPDNSPFTVLPLTSPDDYGGNQLMIQLDTGEYAFYAHFQPGSLRVRPGDHVETGDILGLLGNSGNSDAPHLHFQLSDGPDVLTSASLPFVIDGWTLAGIVSDELSTATTAVLVGQDTPQVKTFPLQDTVAGFP